MANLPVPANEQNRLKALKDYTILDTLPEEEFDRLTKVASIVCGMPISLVTLLDEDRQWFKSKVGLDEEFTPRKDSFCQYAILGDNLFEVTDAWEDDRFRNNPLVQGPPHVRFYAGVPLIDPNGFALGSLCVIDHVPHKLSSDQRTVLSMLAEEVVANIVSRKERLKLQNYETLFLESQDLICIAGADGYFRKINPAFQRVLGWSHSILKENTFYSFIHPEEVEKTAGKVKELVETGNPLNITTRFKTSRGDYKYIQWLATLDENKDSIYAIGRDTTAFTRIQRVLRDVSEFQKKILNGTDYSIISTNIEGLITTFNKGAQQMLGYKPSEVIHSLHIIDFFEPREISQLMDALNSSHGLPLHSAFEALTTRTTSGAAYTDEFTFLRKNGSQLAAEISISRLENTDRETTGYLVIAKDISERKATEIQLQISERRHRVFFENSPSLMCTHDLEGNFLSVNPAGVELLGYTMSEFKKRSLFDIIQPKYHPDIQLYLRQIKTTGSSKGLMQVIDKHGIEKTWMYTNVLSEFMDGTQYVIGNGADLTKRIEIEKELHKSKETAERNARAKDIFLANMSHEIRTPMNAIIGFSNLLKDTELSQDQQDFTQSIHMAAENLMGIINDILDLSKIESGHLTIEEIPFDLKELVKNIKAILSQKASEKNLDLDYTLDERLPEQVVGDPTRLNQILLNLVNNALKFTENGTVHLQVDLLQETETEHTFLFSIKDTGIGIPAEKLESIFERFTQADTDTTRKYGGTGLGLSISKLLIELQKGTLWVESKPNEGSTFIFKLPLKKATTQIKRKSEHAPKVLTSDSKLKILLVEDNVLNQRLAMKVLSNFGFVPELAENGKIAVEKIRNVEYDLVLMDLQMPEMDGYQATEAIRNILRSNVPIIAMTAHSLVGERDKCLAVGMNEYIPKPFSPSELFNKIVDLAIPLHEMQEASINPSGPFVDLTYLKQISDDSKEFEQEMIELFLEQAPIEMGIMEKAIQSAEHATIKDVAHKLKSSYAMMGIQENGLLKLIEFQGASGSSIDEIRKGYERLKLITEYSLIELQQLLQPE
ncbi:PAS domain S-box protein [Arundinibacter roseus]|uniref:Sensory/regulatory protein RpfC n=1 Tax=Arundinibacter roseus TaxID=2070510 RepID=A0A4R4KJR2_9BACT|nr:PAS domain S-box protein [Arundinibacter roseus]TDB68223.1 PAS domain S-box protein [Arundinibacter roseus]